ncbi:MAG: lysophospholipid acyltransferase family protein [Clostridiales bacterium]
MIKVIKFISGIIVNIIFKVRHINIENIPKDGPGILCSNHVSEMDMLLISYKLDRLIRYMAKEELFKIPIISSFIRYCGAFPVRRGAGDISAIKNAIELIKTNHIVGVFPEGTFANNKTKIRAKPGAALLAMKTNASIIPVKIEGEIKIFSKIKIIYGKPYKLEFKKDKKYKSKELVMISQEILDTIYTMSEEDDFGNHKG